MTKNAKVQTDRLAPQEVFDGDIPEFGLPGPVSNEVEDTGDGLHPNALSLEHFGQLLQPGARRPRHGQDHLGGMALLEEDRQKLAVPENRNALDPDPLLFQGIVHETHHLALKLKVRAQFLAEGSPRPAGADDERPLYFPAASLGREQSLVSGVGAPRKALIVGHEDDPQREPHGTGDEPRDQEQAMRFEV